MTDASVEHTWRPTQRLTPDRVRSVQFTRTPIGRRGLSEEEVAQFMQRVADDIAARDASEASLRAKVAHYKSTLVQWQQDQTESRSEDLVLAAGEHARPTVEAVNILSRAQQEADAYVAQTQEYCRRLAADAQDHAQEILADAKARAAVVADGSTDGRGRPEDGNHFADLEELERRLVWARTFLTSLETVEAQLRTAREALAYEFDKMDGAAPRHTESS